MGYRKYSFSDALRKLMALQVHVLEPQRGNPPQGKCVDCRKDVPAHEIAVKCDRCDNCFVCVRCIDKHDHLHAKLESLGVRVS
jgi:hypothetical protein